MYGRPKSSLSYETRIENLVRDHNIHTAERGEFDLQNPRYEDRIPIQVSLTALRMQKIGLEKEVRRLADVQERTVLMTKIKELTFQKHRLEAALNQAKKARSAIVGIFSSETPSEKQQLENELDRRHSPNTMLSNSSLEPRDAEQLPRKPVYIRQDSSFHYRRRFKWLLMGMVYKMSRIKKVWFGGNGNSYAGLFSGKRGISLVGLLTLSVLLVYTQFRLIQHVENTNRTVSSGPRCQLRFAPEKSRPMVALASFPGSGNTWLRHLIEQATGIYTGNVKRSPVLDAAGFRGEDEDWRSGTTIVQKSHDFSRDLIRRFHSSVLLIRNPYKAMLAEASREHAGKTGFAPLDIYYNEKGWDLYVKKYSSEWESQVSQWLLFHDGPMLLVRYEDIKDNPLHELRRITKFLNVIFEDSRVACVIKNMDGTFHRPDDDRRFLGFDPFTDEMHLNIEERIERVNDLLEVKGFKHVARVYPG
ncbi:sialate:O-sulfotransferase 1-like [Glandiceps talaboti]